MSYGYTRALLFGAYFVVLLEILIPFFDHPVATPIRQSAGVLFVVLNLFAFVTLRPKPLLICIAILDALIAVSMIIGGIYFAITSPAPHMSDLGFVFVLAFFGVFAPSVAATFLYRQAIAPNPRLERP